MAGLVLTLQRGDTTLEIHAPSLGPAAGGGRDLNPLIDEELFLSVLEDLRPYPQ